MNQLRTVTKTIISKAALVSIATAFGLFSATSHAQGEMETVKENLEKILPSVMEITDVKQTDMEGVYEVIAGAETMFFYNQGKFVMIGEVFDAERRVSWAQERREKAREKALVELDELPESNMIIMGDPEGERYVTVFTDTDCGWCQKFHQDIPELAKGGLKVRYMMWPRAGLKSASYREAVSVWCAEDQGEAMTIAKNRKPVEQKSCENPVADHYALGFRLGVQGTPFVMLDNGEVLGGYVPPARLLAAAELK